MGRSIRTYLIYGISVKGEDLEGFDWETFDDLLDKYECTYTQFGYGDCYWEDSDFIIHMPDHTIKTKDWGSTEISPCDLKDKYETAEVCKVAEILQLSDKYVFGWHLGSYYG